MSLRNAVWTSPCASGEGSGVGVGSLALSCDLGQSLHLTRARLFLPENGGGGDGGGWMAGGQTRSLSLSSSDVSGP